MVIKAVIYGAGNIGRGFIGALFARAGYQTTFVDVSENVIKGLNEAGNYPLRIVSNEGFEDIEITGVSACHGGDMDAVAKLISETDIVATAVGVNALNAIMPNLTAGIKARFVKTDSPLDIIICENLMDANKVIEGMIKVNLTQEEKALFDQRIGLVEASIGRMVPVQTTESCDGNPLRVCVEPYGFLPVDADAFKGELPEMENLVPVKPFDYYIRRKLFLHNMGHAMCAYLGNLLQLDYIWESISNPEVYILVKNAMLESAQALCGAFDENLPAALSHVDDLLYRFGNSALGDTCERVGRDIQRKLGKDDRLIGAAQLCIERGSTPVYIALGAGAASLSLLGANADRQDVLETLKTVSKLERNSKLAQLIADMYGNLAQGGSLGDVRRLAEKLKRASMGDVI